MHKKLLLILSILLVIIGLSFIHNTPPTKFSSEEFIKTTKQYINIVDQQDPGIALQTMRDHIKTDNRLAAACHDILHEVGHEAFKKYEDFAKAMGYRDELCNSAYIHGVIEGFFAQSSNALALMNSVCTNYPLGKYLSWECFHGVGHALMFYTNNDLPKSLQLCNSYSDSLAKSSCINGVFMENFTTEQLEHHTKYLKSDDLFYPCDDQPTSYKTDCYLYAPIQYLDLHPQQYQKALTWCKSAETNYIGACLQGIGIQAMKDNINHPLLVERICSTSQSCVVGMTTLLINHYASLIPAQKLCHQLNSINQSACKTAIYASAPLFPNPSL